MARGKDLKEALRWATVVAAFATQKVGAQEGLPKKALLTRTLNKWKD
jgi:sugar/nucleoside kinase (ribokinase family)